MNKSITGMRILNTRPKNQGKNLSLAIENAGGSVIECPALEIHGLPDSWIDTLPNPSKVDMAIFISPNAVQYAFEALKQKNWDWASHIVVFAIGKSTAEALNKYGIYSVLIPTIHDSEHLLKLEELNAVTDKTILLFKGNGGLQDIEQKLIQRQANIIICPVYERIFPIHSSDFIESIWKNDAADIILITSETALMNLFILFKEPNATAWLKQKPFLVLSQRLANKALDMGISKIWITTTDTILDTLITKRDSFMTGNDTPITTENHEPETSVQKCKKSGWIFILAISAVSLLALVLSLYSLAQNRDIRYLISKQKNPISSAIQRIQKEQDSLKQALSDDRTQQKELVNKFNQLQETSEAFDKQKKYSTQNWITLKARYYLEMAQIQAHWDEDTDTTIALLQQADNLLSDLNSSDLFDIRQSLASEISQLKSRTQLDLPGLLSQLDALHENVNELTIETEKTLPVTNITQQKSDNTWRDNLQESMKTFEKMVVIRKQDDASIQPVLSSMQIRLVKENIHISLKEAEWALLNRNQVVYQHALNQAINSVKKHFDPKSDKTKAVLLQLQSLQGIELKIQKLDMNKSLNMLNEWIADHMKMENVR